jgi:DNA-binding response OmpR family regulator
MVVDDSPTIRELIALNLGLEGYDVVTAEDG